MLQELDVGGQIAEFELVIGKCGATPELPTVISRKGLDMRYVRKDNIHPNSTYNIMLRREGYPPTLKLSMETLPPHTKREQKTKKLNPTRAQPYTRAN